MILLKDQLFQGKIVLFDYNILVTDISDIRPFLSSMSGSNKRTKRHVGRPKSPENLKATSGNVFMTCGEAEKQ